MSSNVYETSRLADIDLKRIYKSQLDRRSKSEKKAPPLAELIYLLGVSFSAYGAFLALRIH